jgi:2-oxo-4-hydroxy-4-carboxy--5-ureidoimidazoline (OHCU) decarboxylase
LETAARAAMEARAVAVRKAMTAVVVMAAGREKGALMRWHWRMERSALGRLVALKTAHGGALTGKAHSRGPVLDQCSPWL